MPSSGTLTSKDDLDVDVEDDVEDEARPRWSNQMDFSLSLHGGILCGDGEPVEVLILL